MPADRHSPVVARRFGLPLAGVVYLVFTALLGVAAMNSQNNLLFWIFGVLVAAFALSFAGAGVMMLGLGVRRLVPRHGAVGEPLAVQYALTNRHRVLPLFNVHLEERGPSRRRRATAPVFGADPSWQRLMAPAPAWVMHAGPRETVHGEAVFWPRRRGEARFDEIRAWTTFPFGLLRVSVRVRQPQRALVHPRTYELRPRVLRAITPVGPLGMRISQRAGSGDDYYGMREYRPGDGLRHVAWKRSALLDQLVVVERTHPSPPRLRIVLDLRTPTSALRVGDDEAVSARALEERAISLAASLVRAADFEGYEVGLTALGTPLPPIPMRRSHWHVARIMAALASIDLDLPRIAAGPAALASDERCGLVVIHADRADLALGRPETWHLTARQLDQLAVRALGWDENAPAAREAAA